MHKLQERRTFTGWIILAVLIMVALFFVLTPHNKASEPADGISRKSPLALTSADAFVTRFSGGIEQDRWYLSDFEMKDHFVQAGWSPDNISTSPEGMALMITDIAGQHTPFTASEIQRRGLYGYGRYEVIMKAAKGSGLVSSFFTHTGPYFGDPHDEIDIEFLGNDTTRLHMNYFNNGIKGKSIIHDLPYDAAEEFHLYAFEWEKDTIRWYLDGEMIYELPDGASPPPPTTASRVIMNIWTGSPAQYAWHGKPEFESGANAVYRCASFRPQGSDDPMCSDQQD